MLRFETSLFGNKWEDEYLIKIVLFHKTLFHFKSLIVFLKGLCFFVSLIEEDK